MDFYDQILILLFHRLINVANCVYYSTVFYTAAVMVDYLLFSLSAASVSGKKTCMLSGSQALPTFINV